MMANMEFVVCLVILFSLVDMGSAGTDNGSDICKRNSTISLNAFQWMECAVKTKEFMFFSAGFMSSALLFSMCCLASKCKVCAGRKQKSEISKDKCNDNEISHDESQLIVEQNEGSCESDQKSYAYWDIKPGGKTPNDMNSSVKSAKSFQRESYDFVEHHRAKSSCMVEVDIPNPYNHVTVDNEVTEYDDASHVKPRIEIKDPTYSHLSEVKKESLKIEIGNTENNRAGEEETIATSESKDNHEEKVEVELETTDIDDDTCKENGKYETNTVINDECKKESINDNGEDHYSFKRHRDAYSVVLKNPNADNVDCKNAAEKAFIFANRTSESSPVEQSCVEISFSDDNDAPTSPSQSDSEKSTSQNESDTESVEVDCPSKPLAINVLYEDFDITDKDLTQMSNELD